MKKIVIVMTRTCSGGNLALRLLGRELQKRGFSVKVYPCNFLDLIHANSRTTLLKMRLCAYAKDFVKWIFMILKIRENPFGRLLLFRQQILPFVSDDTIVVYSEAVYGNPLHAKNIVRWFLYHNRFPNNPEAYVKDELVFSFRELFNDYNLNPSCRLFTLNYFDNVLYKQTNYKERNGVCYIIRKGKNRPDLPKIFDGPVIDDLSEKEKVAELNRCKYCYDYDTQTFYTSIACVCGCIPIVVMEPGKKKSDYLGKDDVDYGIAYGNTPEEIEYAIETRPLRLKMLDFDAQNKKNIDYFMNEVENFFTKVN